jgi:hypothetical protein
MKKSPLVILLISAFVLASCTAIRPLEVKYQGIKSSGFYSTSAATKSSVVRQVNDNLIVCSEPAPDATYDEEANASLDLDLFTIGNKDSEGSSEGEVEAGLGGRSVNVLLTREMYYRMCEFFANTNMPDSLKVEIYKTTLQSIVGLNSQNFGTGTSGNSSFQGSFNESSAFQLPNSIQADPEATQSKKSDSSEGSKDDDMDDNDDDDEGF